MSSTNEEIPEVGLPESTRRSATRYDPVRRDICLACSERSQRLEADKFHEGPTVPGHGSQCHFALLLDISQTGASIVLDLVPQEDHGVWLRLEGEDVPTDWTEAEVVGVTTTSRGPHLVRLAFRVPCDFEMLRAAICG